MRPVNCIILTASNTVGKIKGMLEWNWKLLKIFKGI